MARRKQEADRSSATIALLIILCIVVFALNGFDRPLEAIITAGLIVAAAVALSGGLEHLRRRDLIRRVSSIVEEHADELAKQRSRLIKTVYGKVITDRWEKEIDRFIDLVVVPDLSPTQQSRVGDVRLKLAQLVDLRAKQQMENGSAFKDFRNGMDGVDFEAFCAEQLRSYGWAAQLTRRSGDQGVDVIAKKNCVTVVLQCKSYSSGSVGNSAVQEIAAGRALERADYAAVVTNAPYTTGAQELAKANGVYLLHHSELGRLEAMLPYTGNRHVAGRSSASNTTAVAVEEAAELTCAEAPIFELPEVQPVKNGGGSAEVVSAENSPNWYRLKRLAIVLTGAILVFSLLQSATTMWHDRTRREARSNSVGYARYENQRFGYKISYPNTFRESGANADGMTVSSADGQATLEVAGTNNDGNRTIRDIYDETMNSTPNVGYSKLGGSWFVITGTVGDRVVYRKVFLGSGSCNAFSFTFPKSRHSAYDSVVTRIEKSFKPGDLGTPHWLQIHAMLSSDTRKPSPLRKHCIDKTVVADESPGLIVQPSSANSPPATTRAPATPHAAPQSVEPRPSRNRCRS